MAKLHHHVAEIVVAVIVVIPEISNRAGAVAIGDNRWSRAGCHCCPPPPGITVFNVVAFKSVMAIRVNSERVYGPVIVVMVVLDEAGSVKTTAPSSHALVRSMHTGRMWNDCIKAKTGSYKNHGYLLGSPCHQGL